jgi:predicted HTH transcriptional regulator
MNDEWGEAPVVERLIARDEGKTLEFKENCNSLLPLARTVVAFANTAGGVVVIGVRDKTREIVGGSDALREEERLAGCFAQRIRPLLIPDIRITSWRGRDQGSPAARPCELNWPNAHWRGHEP